MRPITVAVRKKDACLQNYTVHYIFMSDQFVTARGILFYKKKRLNLFAVKFYQNILF